MRRMVFLAISPIQNLDLAGPADVLTSAGGYRVEVCSPTPDALSCGAGLRLSNVLAYQRVRGALDTLLVVGGEGARTEQNADLLRWVKRTAARARRVVSVCTGAFVLARAGLLDNKRAVTHWQACRELRDKFPRVQVDPAALFLKQGKVYTSAGVSAGIDLTLALVEEDLGRAQARRVAQELVLFLRRSGGQQQFSPLLALQEPQRERMRELRGWIFSRVRSDLSLERLADRSGMSVRHFCRVFQEETGSTPGKYVETVRVEVARELLLQSRLGLKQIADQCGFGSEDTLRRVFQRVVGTTPSDFRARFR